MNYCVNCGRKRNDENTRMKGFLDSQLFPFERFLCVECLVVSPVATKPLFNCILTDKVVPKSRPRVTKNATFFPASYTNWRKAAREEIDRAIFEKICLETEIADKNLTPKLRKLVIMRQADLLPFDKSASVAIFVDFFGSLRGNSDLDNAIGSILDVLAFEGWCLSQDNVQRVPLIQAVFHSLPKSTKKNPQQIRTVLKIYPLPGGLSLSLPEPAPVKPPSSSRKKVLLPS